MKVAVLGGGPAGMMAAWAAIQCGHNVTVYDKNASQISVGSNHGVFALWDDCDLFLSQKVEVQIGIIGAKGLSYEDIGKKYAQKVYNNLAMSPSVSITKFGSRPKMVSYNHSEAYQQIIDILGKERIKQLDVKHLLNDIDLVDWPHNDDLIIVTIPADVIFPNATWPCSKAYIYHGYAPPEDAFMIYNVNEHMPWYRCSAIFNKFSMEYPYLPLTDKNYVRVKKVLDPPRTPEQLVSLMDPKYSDYYWFTGRFGAWKKDMLTEDVYWDVIRRFNDKRIGAKNG